MEHSESSIQERVSTVSLNQALKSYTVIHLLKMDFEGADFDIFPNLLPPLLDTICEIKM